MKRGPVVLSEREEAILQEIYTFHLLTTRQVCRLFFSETSINYAGKFLKQLYDAHLLDRFPLPSTDRGNRELVYTLSRQGIQFLARQGKDMQYWVKQKNTPLSYLHMQHSLLVNDVLIAARILAKQTPGIKIRNFQHEWYLKHAPLSVSLPGNRVVSVVPDGFVDFSLALRGKTYHSAIWVEADRASEEARFFRQKIRALHTVITSRACQEYFHTDTITVAIATTGDEKRRKVMGTWIEDELTTMHAVNDGYLFLLVSLPLVLKPVSSSSLLPPALDPVKLFLHPVWSVPFEKELQPLLDLS